MSVRVLVFWGFSVYYPRSLALAHTRRPFQTHVVVQDRDAQAEQLLQLVQLVRKIYGGHKKSHVYVYTPRLHVYKKMLNAAALIMGGEGA